MHLVRGATLYRLMYLILTLHVEVQLMSSQLTFTNKSLNELNIDHLRCNLLPPFPQYINFYFGGQDCSLAA
uniref:Putative ovule protein n=1 Tax=Solanum chacoense TaxID=4108 RepID=A0A0V0GVE8_SOLCH